MDNLTIYNKYKSVPKIALKDFDNGNFKGTDINTMWRIKCLTEEFGVCGVGWYFDIVNQWKEQGENGEVMCFAEIKLFIKVDNEWSKGISATGGHRLVQYVKSKDYLKNNDEGYKMAITDAFGVACKYLGIGADVYWANDKTKYSDSEEKEYFPKYEQKKQAKKNNDTLPWKDEAVGADVYATGKEYGFSTEDVNAVIMSVYKQMTAFDLTIEQANELIQRMKKKGDIKSE